MTLLRRPMLALVAIFAVALSSARADDAPVPMLSGALTGKFSAPRVRGFPEVDWNVSVKSIKAGRAEAEFSAKSAGGQFRGTADFDVLTGNGRWQISEGEFDASPWFAVIAPELGGSATGLKAIGTIRVSGSGPLVAHKPAGTVQLSWKGGALRHESDGWSLDDITMSGDYAVDATDLTVKSVGPVELTVRTITTKRFGARNVLIRGMLKPGGFFELLEARVEIAGGNITVDACTFPLSPPVLDFTVRIDRVGLQDIVGLVPESLSDARGRVDGIVRLGWSSAKGVQIGAGNLALRNDEPAMVRLRAVPGFLTQRFPERIVFLPSWTGPLARWIAPVNPAYPELKEIEMGQTDLRVQSLTIDLTPDQDPLGRTASIFVSARPIQPSGTVNEVTFQVNLTGPLVVLLRAGLRQNMSVKLQ